MTKNFFINYIPQSKSKIKNNLTNLNDNYNYENHLIKKLKSEELIIQLPSNVLRKCSPRTDFDKNSNLINNTDINIKINL